MANWSKKNRPIHVRTKPYDTVLVGTACRVDPDTKELIVPFLSEIKRLDEIPYMEFLDYKTGKKYPNDSSMEPQYYWKTWNLSWRTISLTKSQNWKEIQEF